MLKNLSTLILSIAIFALAFTSLLAINHSMSQDHSGKMISCIMTDKDLNVCQMNIAEHISKWQEMFFATFDPFTIPIFLVSFVAFTLAYFKVFGPDPPPRLKNSYQLQAYLQQLHHHIQEDLSKGILHPKIYA
ncbi:MAG: hypothetical protein Q8P25_02620 [Candidatus Curtissbacteria bacterium]|nr:hypothetical protein [Candidatus Curtissbacteria bacterium]